ncbi:MAG TPA: hypothetical protein VFW12_04135 [Candidatus Limnocylindria bacterium]|nr:hypothetical protein [Candidatus Limnocylindria bacterium]
MTYRLRAPRPRRGYEIRVARLEGDRVIDLTAIRAAHLASPSLERACLVALDDELLLYLSSVDRSDGRWRIDLLTTRDPRQFDATSPTLVLSAASTASEGVKDPVVVADAAGLAMYASVAVPATPPDHTTGDVFGTGTVRSATGLARSADGRRWTWEGVVLSPPETGWDAYETRISCLLAPGLALYDGIARPEDNYEERTGIARRGTDGRWTRVTTDGPVLPVRYVAFDGERFFWEHPLPDGAHELRAAAPSLTLDTAALP